MNYILFSKINFTVNGVADLCYCGIWVQPDRNNFVDFSHSFQQRCATFLVPRPRITDYKWFSIFLGISTDIWTALLVIIVIVFLALFSLMTISNKLHVPHTTSTTNNERIPLITIILGIVRVLTTPDSIPSYSTPGYTLVLTCWSVCCLFLTNFYSSDLVSFLILPRYTERINSAEQFARSNLSWESNLQPNFNFLDLSLKSHQLIKQNFQLENNTDARVRHLISGTYAVYIIRIHDQFVMITGRIGITASNIPVSYLRLMRSCIYSPYIAFGFRHGSPFKDAMETKLRWLFEAGITHYVSEREIRKVYATNWESVLDETDVKGKTPEVLRVEHIVGAFIILIALHSISFIVFLVEKIINARRPTR